MGLQIRVRHALGERVIELADRTADDPVVVGRSSSADVQVPSVTVGGRHCALFVHEGHWVVQDLGAGGGTAVNGAPVDAPVMLQIGDKVTVGGGAAAPTIEIDPAAAAEGRTGYAGTGLPHLQPPQPFQAAPAAYSPPSAYSAAPAYGAGGYAAPVPGGRPPGYPAPPPAYAPADAAETEPAMADDIGQLASAAASRGYRRRRKKSGVGGQVVAVIVAALLIGGVTTYVIINRNQEAAKQTVATESTDSADNKKPATTQSAKPAVATPQTAPGGTSGAKPAGPAVSPVRPSNDPRAPAIDPKPPANPKPPAATKPSVAVNPPTTEPPEEGMDMRRPTPPSTDPKPPVAVGPGEGMDPITRPPPASAPVVQDAENMDPVAANKWESMVKLDKESGKESFAIMRFENFRKMNPGKYDAQIDAFIEKKLDRIWWERIDQLMARMKSLDEEMKNLRAAVVDVNDPDQKKKMIDSFEAMKKEKEQANKTVRKTMGYEDPAPPPLANDSALAEMAKKRNSQLYNNWKLITLNTIKKNEGKLSWME